MQVPPPVFLNAGTTDETYQNLKNKIRSYTYWKVQLVYMKVQVHSFSEPPLEYNQGYMPFSSNLGVT